MSAAGPLLAEKGLRYSKGAYLGGQEVRLPLFLPLAHIEPGPHAKEIGVPGGATPERSQGIA